MKTIALSLILCVSAFCQTQASSPPAASTITLTYKKSAPVALSVPQKPDYQQVAGYFDARLMPCIALSQNLACLVQLDVALSSPFNVSNTIGTAASIVATYCVPAQDDHPANERGRMALSTLKNASAQPLVNPQNSTEDPARSLACLVRQSLRIRDPRRQLG